MAGRVTDGIFFIPARTSANIHVARFRFGMPEQRQFRSPGDSTLVDSCLVRTVGGNGIYAAMIQNSAAIECGLNALVTIVRTIATGRA